jgi:hypothetical protein
MNKWNLENKIKIISVLIAILTITAGIIQYRITNNENFRKAFWEKRYELYTNVISIASEIANSNSLEESKNYRKEFWKLYWGNLSLIEDVTIERAMVKYGKLLAACEEGTIPEGSCFQGLNDSTKLGMSYVNRPGLRKLSFDLAHCARESLKNTWDPVGIESLEENKCPYKDIKENESLY